MQRSNIQTWDHVVIIFFCAPLLRQLPLCSLPCHSLSADAEGCAAGLVFMCVSRASLACCDCYPQRLFGKLGAATAVSGFRAKELDPYHRRCHTRFTSESKRRLPTKHVWATRKYRRARSSPSTTLVGGPLRNQRRTPRGRSGGGTLSSASCASAGRRLDNRASFTRTRDGNRAKCSAIGNSWM